MSHVLLRFARATEVITAEHHSDGYGMPWAVCIDGGKHSGVVIHCQTQNSAVWLFNEIVLARKGNYDHPYLTAV